MSATSMPASSRSREPGHERQACRRAAWRRWCPSSSRPAAGGTSGTPSTARRRRRRKHRRSSCSTPPSIAHELRERRHVARRPPRRVSDAACSAGRGRCGSRRRSRHDAAGHQRAEHLAHVPLVAGRARCGDLGARRRRAASAMVSNSPVWWPRLIDSASTASLRTPTIRPANASRRVGSSSVVGHVGAPSVRVAIR